MDVARSQTRSTPETECKAHEPRILVAEDDQELRELIALALRNDGYDVVEARDGVELLGYLEAAAVAAGRGNGHTPVAAVVSDVRMPSLTGLDVLAVLRCAYWPVPVILITAFGDEDTHAEARELGVNAVFDKPFDLEDLCAAVREAAPRW
jgi:CheY-like chemotaxis protein